MSNPRVWFITGCTSGFGRALVDIVGARGERVVATARRPVPDTPAWLRERERCKLSGHSGPGVARPS
jgi:NAD(P)-dependent dehydrogenase (short-subunit alcohol dehydrogenase family)